MKKIINRPGQKPVSKYSLIHAINTPKKEKKVFTKNNALTYASSKNAVLDMFFLAGASRNMSSHDIKEIFRKAYEEDIELALKCLFWARDVRGGAGERRFFRLCMDYLRIHNKDLYKEISIHVPYYGRWDDLFYDLKTATVNKFFIRKAFRQADTLLCKWLPRKGAIAYFLANFFQKSQRDYRKVIASVSNTVEQQMCSNDWQQIVYQKVPSVAINKYRKAFYRNDGNRFTDYINLVKKGRTKINAKAIFPHTLVRALYNGENEDAIQAQWDNLPNYMQGSDQRIIPVCDTSGSMSNPNNIPLDVSIALGVYISERNKGIFKDAFITFSATPELHVVKGSLYKRLNRIKQSNAGFNTNLIGVFDLILKAARDGNVAQEDMPTKVLVISDMEFDGANSSYHGSTRLQKESSKQFLTNYNVIKKKYEQSNYIMPTLIFWNVNGRKENVPAQKDDRVGLVSGFSPAILKSILNGGIYSPMQLMFRTICSDRYDRITINS